GYEQLFGTYEHFPQRYEQLFGTYEHFPQLYEQSSTSAMSPLGGMSTSLQVMSFFKTLMIMFYSLMSIHLSFIKYKNFPTIFVRKFINYSLNPISNCSLFLFLFQFQSIYHFLIDA